MDENSSRRLKSSIKKDEKEESLSICLTFLFINKENYFYTKKKVVR